MYGLIFDTKLIKENNKVTAITTFELDGNVIEKIEQDVTDDFIKIAVQMEEEKESNTL